MIDNQVFEELLERGKEIIIYVSDESDLAVVTSKYNSPKTTTLSSEMLKHLKFIVNQPILIEKLLPRE